MSFEIYIPHKNSVHVCVCVCVCDRERERAQTEGISEGHHASVTSFTDKKFNACVSIMLEWTELTG